VRATAQAFAHQLGIQNMHPSDFEQGIGRGAADYVKAGAEAHGHTLSSDQVQTLVAARQENFLHLLKAEPLPAFPGVLELIQEARHTQTVGLAIATSSTREKSQAVLASAQIPVHHMAYVCGDDVTRKKPDPELFLIACDRLSLQPKHCIVIEDAPNGVDAARAAGCKVIGVTNTCGPDTLNKADLVVDSLSKVRLSTVRDLLGPASH